MNSSALPTLSAVSSTPSRVDARVQALRDYGLLDTPRTPEFDDLCALARSICGTRFAVVNFIDADRQWFQAEVGFGIREMPLDDSICARVLLEPGLIEIPDLTQDPRFSCNPLITAGPELRFYAGAALKNAQGHVLGTLCVLDTKSVTLDAMQREALLALSRQVVSQMELWRQSAELRRRASELHAALAQRDQAEAAQRALEDDHRSIIDHALAGLVVHDGSGAVVFCNRMACELLGMTADQIRGRVPADPAWHFLDEHGGVMPLADYPVSIVARDLRPLTNYVLGVVAKAGATPAWALVNAHPELDESGELVRIVVSFVDITARKLAEERLRDADQRKDEFLAMLGHELRNPLAPVSTAAQLLQRMPGDEARVRAASAIISRQVDHMRRLVDDLLDVSRVTRGLIELAPEALDMREVVTAAVEQVRPLVDARTHTLAIEAPAGAAMVHGDRTRLVQVVANLLNNAAKYTPTGGRIDVNLQLTHGEACVAVRDNGTGIDPGLLPNVFDLFTQAHRSPDRSEGGLGIGLALVKRVIERHGGRVGAESAGAGRGSSFTVCLPTLASNFASGPSVGMAAACTPPPQPELEILIVDDNDDAVSTLSELLTLDGHRVHRAASAADACRIAAAHPNIGVFILDIGLPDMTGHELLHALRATHPHAHAIALSGYGQPQDELLSRAAGFAVHLVKPVDMGQLGNALRQAHATARIPVG